jgi:hypothetical protein
VALCRELSLGDLNAGSTAINVAYLAVMAGLGLWAGGRTYRKRLYV